MFSPERVIIGGLLLSKFYFNATGVLLTYSNAEKPIEFF